MTLSDGSLGKHPALHSESKVKVLPLVVFAQTFEDREFQQAKDWGIDDYLDAPFFDEDVSDVIMEAQMQAKGLRFSMGIKDDTQSVAAFSVNGEDGDGGAGSSFTFSSFLFFSSLLHSFVVLFARIVKA